MGAAIALRDVVGKALHRFLIGIVPLHGHFHLHPVFFTYGMEYGGVQHGFAAAHVFDEALDASAESEVFLLAAALISKNYFYPVVEKRQFAQAARQDIVMKLNLAKSLDARHEMHFGTASFGLSDQLERGHCRAVPKLHLVCFAVAAYGQS